jgi:LysR family transcriptional regulator, hydrogen peroxide-inducible genes activator
MPSLTQLEYIVAVDKYRHFGKAADNCNISQPTLSMQIQKVEEEIGYLLFDRLKKPVVPSQKGQKFIQQARVLLHEHRRLMDLSKLQGSEISGDLRLAVIPTLAPYLLPLFMEDFSKRYPQVHLRVDELKTESIIEALKEDQLDAGLLATPLKEEGIKVRPLLYEPFSLYVSKNHPLAERKRIRESDLKGNEMWLLADGHCFKNQIVRFCSIDQSDGVFPNVQFAGGNLDTLRNIVRKSKGYTLVPYLFVDTMSDSERRDHVREFEKPAPSREVSLIFRRDQWKSDILTALEQTILKNVPEILKHKDPKAFEILPIT